MHYIATGLYMLAVITIANSDALRLGHSLPKPSDIVILGRHLSHSACLRDADWFTRHIRENQFDSAPDLGAAVCVPETKERN